MGKKILAVDDSSTVRQMVSFTLVSAGYEVIEARDGQDAMSKLANPVALGMVLTDLNMPNLDGIGLIRQLRAHAAFKYVPIVVLTTESEAEKKQAARAAGATAWIVKPFRPEQLLAVIQKVLG
ncbi:response regulator [Paludibaculum fermentans]|uniref:response regulator n=1 Tax=Paludibaculum fermentans TaxID=1473598 RepID=UPI003EBF5BD0